MSTAFSPEECNEFAKALNTAWTHLSETGQVQDESVTKAALTRAILEAAEQGERNKDLLVAYALAHVEKAKHELRDRMESPATASAPP
jgi:hypothetical protein